MIQTILVKADLHFDSNTPLDSDYKLVLRFAKAIKPDLVVDLGDWIDFPYLSTFDKESIKTISKGSFKKDYDFGKKDIDAWQSCSKRYIQLQGNHDERVERLLEKNPTLEGVIDYPGVFEYGSRGIEFYRLLDEPLRLGKLTFIHGYWSGRYVARKVVEEYCNNVVFGHIHRFEMASKVLARQREEVQAWSIGCLSTLSPEYMKGLPSAWQKGFAMVYMDFPSGFFNLYPINIINHEFFWEKKLWK